MEKFKLILTLLSTVYFGVFGEYSVTQTMREYKVIPEFVSDAGADLLKVLFDSGKFVNVGNEITPFQSKNIPMVDWNADNNSYYTLICTAPDAPSPSNPFLAELLLLMIVNIPGKDITAGQTIAEYFPPAPPKQAKLNRIIYLLYRQPGKLNFNEKYVQKDTIEGRSNFSTKKFTAKYGLSDPVAANFYLTKFDPYCMEIYKRVNCCFELNELVF